MAPSFVTITSPSGLEIKNEKLAERFDLNGDFNLPDKHLVHALWSEGCLHEGGYSASSHNVDLQTLN